MRTANNGHRRALPKLRCGFKPEDSKLRKGQKSELDAALGNWEERKGTKELTQWEIFKRRRALKRPNGGL
jgi:hypothetical protein